jgi:hypothetical protein
MVELPEGVEVPEEAVRLAWKVLPDGVTHREAADALAAAAPALLAVERERWEAELRAEVDPDETLTGPSLVAAVERARAEKAEAALALVKTAIAETSCDDPTCARCLHLRTALEDGEGK